MQRYIECLTPTSTTTSDYSFFEHLSARAKTLFTFLIALPFNRDNLSIICRTDDYWKGTLFFYSKSKSELILTLSYDGCLSECIGIGIGDTGLIVWSSYDLPKYTEQLLAVLNRRLRMEANSTSDMKNPYLKAEKVDFDSPAFKQSRINVEIRRKELENAKRIDTSKLDRRIDI